MIKRFFQKLISFLGFLTLMVILYVVGMGIYFWYYRKEVAPQTIIQWNISGDYPEIVSDDLMGDLIEGQPLLIKDIVEALEAASEDKHIVGLMATIGNISMGYGKIQEIRQAIQKFRSKGKPAIVYADSFGEFGPGNREYYLATAFDRIYLQPSGDIGLTGLIFQTPFIKGTLDKLGIVPRMDQRMEYKNAMNTFTEKQYTQPHKEALESIMNSMFQQLVTDISTSRNLSEFTVKMLFEKGVFFAKDALDAKLVDGLGYLKDISDEFKNSIGVDVKYLSLSEYASKIESIYPVGDTIALIYGVGGIKRGKSKYYPIFGDVSMGSETVTEAFQAAIEDKDVKAIIFRVDSPGGSYVASDSIWQETIRAKEAGKPVIVSMSDVAGSGGYFISMAANKIVAHPGTITGSIGVFAGKFVKIGLMEKLGITWDEIHTGPYANMWTDLQDYSPEHWQRLQDALDRIYKDFTEKVSKGRKLSMERVEMAAKGRIWTGKDAKDLGLVDELGGLPTAINLAKRAAAIPENTPVTLKIFPKEKSWIEKFIKRKFKRKEDTEMVVAAFKEIQKYPKLIKQLGLLDQDGVLVMPNILYEPVN